MRPKIQTPKKVAEIYKKRRKAKIKKAYIFFVVFILFIFGLSYVSRIPKLNIQTVNVYGNNVLRSDEILGSVNQVIYGKYFYLFSKRNGFIFPSDKVKNMLLGNYKRIETVDIIKNSLTTVTINIKERAGMYLLCGPKTEVDIDDCFYVDDNGLVFSKAPFFSGNVYFRFYDNRVDAPHKVGEKFMDQGEFVRLILFKEYLDNSDIKTNSLVIKDDEQYEFLMEKGSDENPPPVILFNKKNDYRKIAPDMISAISTEPLKSLYKDNYAKLLYLDLRFDNKVYYKFSN